MYVHRTHTHPQDMSDIDLMHEIIKCAPFTMETFRNVNIVEFLVENSLFNIEI